MTFDIRLFQLKAACSTAHAPLGEGPRRKHRKTERPRESSGHLFKPFVPPQKKKGRQTCWSFLLALLGLVAVVELRKGLGCLLQLRHKHLDVVQGAVEDLLRGGEKKKIPHVQHERGMTGERRSVRVLTTSISILWISLSGDSVSCFPDPRLSAGTTHTFASLLNKLLFLKKNGGIVDMWCR